MFRSVSDLFRLPAKPLIEVRDDNCSEALIVVRSDDEMVQILKANAIEGVRSWQRTDEKYTVKIILNNHDSVLIQLDNPQQVNNVVDVVSHA